MEYKTMAIEQVVLTFRVQVAYSYDTEDYPNISMLTARKLREHLESSLEYVRQTDALCYEGISADFIGDVAHMTVST